MANDSKYGRLYPERAVAQARAVLEALAPQSVKCQEALEALDLLGFPPDEPLFLLRGQDELAPETVRFYAVQVYARDAALDPDHIRAFAVRMRAWQPRKMPD